MHQLLARFLPVVGLGIGIGVTAAVAEAQAPLDWSRFRGPNGSGVGDDRPLPVTFGPTSQVAWKTPLPPGHSSPVLTKDRVFVTGVEGETLLTLALDRASGTILWRRDAPRPRTLRVDKRNNPASPTPATDGTNVYVFFQDFGLLSYDRDGRDRWRVPLGPFTNAYGMAASPIVAEGLVVLVCDQSVGSFMVAVDADTGRERWRVERPEAKTGHSTPVVYRPPDGGPVQLLVPGSFYLTAYAIATGEKVWWVRGLAFEMKATPVFDNGVVYIHGTSVSAFTDSYGRKVPAFEILAPQHDRDRDGRFSRDEVPDDLARRWLGLMDLNGDGALDAAEWQYYQAARSTRGGLWAFALGGRGDMTERSVRWHYDRSVPQLPSPLLYAGVLYMINDGGIMTSLDPARGTVLAQGRVRDAIDSYYASPVAANGKIFIVSESGKVGVIKADGTLAVLAVNDLDDLCYATPAVGDGHLYIRTRSALYSFALVD